LSFIKRTPVPFPCSIGWTVSPPEPRINAAFVLSGCGIRMLYFFHARVAAVLVHGLVKEREVPPRDIEEAIRRKLKFGIRP
jgi:hypothetical protein